MNYRWTNVRRYDGPQRVCSCSTLYSEYRMRSIQWRFVFKNKCLQRHPYFAMSMSMCVASYEFRAWFIYFMLFCKIMKSMAASDVSYKPRHGKSVYIVNIWEHLFHHCFHTSKLAILSSWAMPITLIYMCHNLRSYHEWCRADIASSGGICQQRPYCCYWNHMGINVALVNGMSSDLNPLRTKFFRDNINIYLHFMSFLHSNKTQVVEITPWLRQGPAYST